MGLQNSTPEDRSILASKLGLSAQDDNPLLARLVPANSNKITIKPQGSRVETPRSDAGTISSKFPVQSLSDEQISFAKIESKLEAIRQVL